MTSPRLLITAVACAACLGAAAETHYKPHVSVGAHGGCDLSQVTFAPSVKQRWLTGPDGGVAVRYAEEKLFGIVAEINFNQRGWSENYDMRVYDDATHEVHDVKSPLRYSRKLSYLSVPVMTHISFGPPRFKCFINLGPEFSYMVGEATESNFDYRDPTHAEGWPNEKRMTQQLTMATTTKFDYGIVAGLGCEFWLKPRHSVYAEGRFYYGLGNIFPASKADTFSASRNMAISVNLGYFFRIK